jgi:hypothetical protein
MGYKKNAPLSAGTGRRTSSSRIKAAINHQAASTVADAMKRVQPRHKGYIMQRAAGKTPAEAWNDTMPKVNNPDGSARRLEERPAIRTALAVAEEAVIRGSLMSAAQRRDYVLDRLIEETTKGGDSARVRSLELLGKTAGLFIDKSETPSSQKGDIKTRIEQMIRSISERDISSQSITIEQEPAIDGEAQRVNDADSSYGETPLVPHPPRTDSA